MNKEDKLYGVRISFDFGNPITLELKGAGRVQIIPRKDYFFENAPIEFINYLAQLKGFGVSYRITTDKKGCFNTLDLKNYNQTPRIDVLRNYRAPSKLKDLIVETKEESKEVKATEEDIIKVSPVKVEEPKVEKLPTDQTGKEITQELKESSEDETINIEGTTIEDTDNVETTVDTLETEPELEPIAEPEDEPQEGIHVYTEDELKDLTKKDLLAIAADLDLPVSDINTKKEIRAAILNKNN